MLACITRKAAGVVAIALAACDPCAPDEYEPNEAEGEAAVVGDITTDLSEIDVNFSTQEDVDCFAYALPEPILEQIPILYIEMKGANREDFSGSLTFACDSGEPAFFSCNNEDLTDPTCAVSGVEPRFRVSYDCDPDTDAIGAASLVVCLERPTPNKLCVDYSVRAYFN